MVRKEFDLVIFGATGYTGKFVVRELIQQIRSSTVGSISWAVAGRSKQKLSHMLASVAADLDLPNIDVPTIEADVQDENSIKAMCERTRLVVNCVGPYRFFGEQVVKQCVESGTHHIDVSGEPEYLEKMQLLYGKKAAEKDVCVIGSCGFDSVPADLGFLFTKNSFKNDLNHVESYLTIDFGKAPASANFGTWESAVYGFASAGNLGRIRKQLFPTRLPRPSHPIPKRNLFIKPKTSQPVRIQLSQPLFKSNLLGFFYDQTLKKYCFPFLGSDKSVVQRTQYFLWEQRNERAIHYMPYFTIGSLVHVFMFLLWAVSFGLLANFKFGRHLLLKYYKLFSFGYVSKKETTFSEMVSSRFSMQFRGCGFDTKSEENHTEKPNKFIVTEISGPEPGYIATAKIILACGIALLEKDEKSKLPLKGGVFTPGAAFFDANSDSSVDLIDRLRKNGIEFKVIRNDSNSSSSSSL